MGGPALVSVPMVLMMVVMMVGMLVGGAWAFLRRRRR